MGGESWLWARLGRAASIPSSVVAHLGGQDTSTKITHGDLELPVAPLNGDLDGDEGVHGDGHGGGHGANAAALSSCGGGGD